MYTKSQLMRIATYAALMHHGFKEYINTSVTPPIPTFGVAEYVAAVSEALCHPEAIPKLPIPLDVPLGRLLTEFGSHLALVEGIHNKHRADHFVGMRRRFQDFIVADNLAKRMEIRRAEPPKYVTITYTDSYGPRPTV
jgi:hypothetical protein